MALIFSEILIVFDIIPPNIPVYFTLLIRMMKRKKEIFHKNILNIL